MDQKLQDAKHVSQTRIFLESKMLGLEKELQCARLHINSLEFDASILTSKCLSDTGLQVDVGDMFKMVDSKCEDLRRAMHQADRDKLAAEAFAIQTKAELARAEHRVSCLEREISSYRTNSSIAQDNLLALRSSSVQSYDARDLTDVTKLHRQLQASRVELDQFCRVVQNANDEADSGLAEHLEQHRSVSRLRESDLQDSLRDVQQRLFVAEQAIRTANDRRGESERDAHYSLKRAEDCLLQLNRCKGALSASSASDRTMNSGEAQESHLHIANAVVHFQMRSLQSAIKRKRSCIGCRHCEDIVKHISLQIESMCECDFGDLASVQRLAKKSGQQIEESTFQTRLASPRSSPLLSYPVQQAPLFTESSHCSCRSANRTGFDAHGSSGSSLPIVLPMCLSEFSSPPHSRDACTETAHGKHGIRNQHGVNGIFDSAYAADQEVVRAYSPPIQIMPSDTSTHYSQNRSGLCNSAERTGRKSQQIKQQWCRSPTDLQPSESNGARVRCSARALLSHSARDCARSSSGKSTAHLSRVRAIHLKTDCAAPTAAKGPGVQTQFFLTTAQILQEVLRRR